MSTIQKHSTITISKHAAERIAERLGMVGIGFGELKAKLAEAIKQGKYKERQATNRSVFQCWMDTDRKKREELFIVVADDGCVVTVIDGHHVYRNRARRWREEKKPNH